MIWVIIYSSIIILIWIVAPFICGYFREELTHYEVGDWMDMVFVFGLGGLFWPLVIPILFFLWIGSKIFYWAMTERYYKDKKLLKE